VVVHVILLVVGHKFHWMEVHMSQKVA